MATAEKLNYLLETKNQIKNAIEGKGVSISDTDSFRSYASKIGQIEGSGGTTGSTDDWQPELDWWDIETILANDIEDYERKAIFLLTDELDDSMTNFIIKGFEKYKLSDGQVKEQPATTNLDITNLFDVTKDKVCSKGYKTRYVIGYTNSSDSIMIKVPINCISLVFDNIKFKHSGSWADSTFYGHYYLQSVILKNNTIYDMINFTSLFENCYSLKNIVGLNTKNGTSFNSMFANCRSLQEIPQLNTSNGTGFPGMFSGCYSLQEVSQLDTSKGSNFLNMFSNCNSLKEISQLDTNNGINFSSMFNGCYSLKEVPDLSTNKGTNFSGMFNICHLLVNIKSINYIKGDPVFSYSKFLNHSSLLRILNALVDLTGQTTQKLTLGATNLAKLTDEEKAIATEKNWTLS